MASKTMRSQALPSKKDASYIENTAAFSFDELHLMIPPFLMSIGFTVVAFRRRNQFHTEPTTEDPDPGLPGQTSFDRTQ